MGTPAADRRTGPETSATARLLRAFHQDGDIAARERLIELYMPLVESLARRYDRQGEEHDDLVQVGSIGLIKAIDRFDLARGGELAAYAVPTIEGEIRRHLRDRGGAIRLPRSMHEQADPAARRRARTPLPLEPGSEPVTGSADDGSTHSHERLLLAGAFRSLDERERRLLYLRFVREESAAAVARDLGVSHRQLSRLTRAALEKVRAEIEGEPQPVREDPETQPKPARRREALPRRRPAPNIAAMGVGRPAVPAKYLARPYHIALAKGGDGDEGWTAQVEELPGCKASGATPGQAAQSLEIAMEEWIAEALAEHREVPEPRSAKGHSGRLLLRMPQSLHGDLARAAEREEVSLNQFIISSLASVVEWQRDGARPDARGSSRWLRTALLVNLAVLVLAAAAALTLLVIALSGS